MENMRPAIETVAPKAQSSYQLAARNNMSTPLVRPPGFTLSSDGGTPGSLVKKKRGRPRKYGPDGVLAGGGGGGGPTLSPVPISAAVPPPKNIGDRILSGGSFTPHIVTVNPGEDVTSKIISFTKDGPRSICVLSALGVISHVTLRHASSSVGTVTYEGRFEILSLSGYFAPGEFGGLLSRETKMNITLSSPDGRVVGGQLGGLLTAASPVQVVVASFLPRIGGPTEPKPKKPKAGIKPLTPNECRADMDDQNVNERVRESPYRHLQLEKCATSSEHDWRRAVTDMNVSLNED